MEDDDDVDMVEEVAAPQVPQREQVEEGENPDEMASAILDAHTQGIHSIDIHPTLPLVVTGGEDDKTYLWTVSHDSKPAEPVTLKPERELAGHTDTVIATSFSADGTLLATGGMDGRIQLWNVADGTKVATMEDLGDSITYMFWHPKNILFAGSMDSQSAMWNEKGVCLQYFTGHASEVTCGALVKENKMLATGSEDFSVKVFAPKSGELQVHFDSRGKGMYQLPAEAVTALAPHPRVADTLLAGYAGGRLAVLSIASKKVLAVVQAHAHAIEKIAVSTLYPYFATCCAGEGWMTVWNAESNNVVVRDQVKQDAGFVDCKFVGEHLYACDTQGEVKRYDARGVSTSPHKVCWLLNVFVHTAFTPFFYITRNTRDTPFFIFICSSVLPYSTSYLVPQRFTGHLDTALCFAVHEDGWIASGSDDATARFFHPSA